MKKYQYIVYRYGAEILASPGMEQSKNYIQHGNTSIYEHSFSTALMCLYITRGLRLKVDEKAMVRGALLHDYFLYDWHVKAPDHRWHGFTHPAKAMDNARRDFSLCEVEEDMILSHMFPMTPKLPLYRESWILWGADKICSIREIMHR